MVTFRSLCSAVVTPVPARVRCALALVAFASMLTLPLGCVDATNPFDPETDVTQQAKASLTGTVRSLIDDAVVVGAEVSLKGVNSERLTTDDQGVFAFTGLTPGVTTVEVRHPSHQTAFRDLLLSAGERRADVDIELVPLAEGAAGTGSLEGAILRGDQVALPTERQDHSGVIVDVVGTGLRTVTTPDGTYQFTLAPGSYELAFTANGHQPQRVAAQQVTESTATVVDTITLAINPGVVRGRILLEGQGAADAVHGGTVVSIGASTTQTATDGTFALTDLAAGVQTLRATHSDHGFAERIVTVVAGADVEIDDVVLLKSRGSVAGRVDLIGLGDDSGVLVSLDGTAFATLSTTDGSYQLTGVPTGTFQVRAQAPGFRAAATPVVTVLADGVATVGAISLVAAAGDFLINNGAVFTNDAEVTLLVESDDATQMRVSEDPTFSDVAMPVVFSQTSSFTLSDGDGEKTIFVELLDAQGAVLTTLSASITLDTAPPETIGVTIDGGNAFSRDAGGRLNLGLNAQDSGTGVASMQISFDGVFDTEPFVDFTTTQVAFVPGNAEGPVTVSVRYADNAGNQTAIDDAATATITLDRIAPVVTAISIEGGAGFARSSVVAVDFTLDPASTDATVMALSTDADVPNPVFQAITRPLTFLLAPGEGTRSVGIRVQDAAGNISDAVDDDITVDLTPPAAPTVQLADGAAFTTTRTVAVSLSAQDFTEVRVSIDGNFDGSAAAETFSTTVPTSVTFAAGDGTKTVFAQFRDAAGNESTVVTDTIVLDTAPPTLGGAALSLNAGAAFTNSVSVTASFSVSGAATMAVVADEQALGAAISVADGDFQPFSATSVVLLPAGDCSAANCKRVCAIFRDAAGNSSAQACDQITLDGTAPSTPIFDETDFTQADKNIVLSLVSQPEDAFFSHLELLVDPTQPTFVRFDPDSGATANIPFTVPTSVLQLPAERGLADASVAVSDHLLRVRAVDQAGNRSVETTVRVTLDDVAPATPRLAGLPNTQNGVSIVNADTIQVNFVLDNPADDDATFSHYLVTSSLIPAPTPTTQRDALIFTLVPNSDNVITIIAVDAAGNESTPVTATVREDSDEPTTPTITPASGSVRAREVEVSLVTPSTDGLAETPVSRYQLKDAAGNFVEVGTGPHFTATLAARGSTEVCLRGVDTAGNTSIEACATYSSAREKVAVEALADPRGHDLFGDFIAYGADRDTVLRDLRTGEDLVLTAGLNDPSRMSPAGDLRIDGRGPVYRIATQSQDGDSIAVFGVVTDVPTPELRLRRKILGRSPDIQDDDLVFQDLAGRLKHVQIDLAPANGTAPGVLDPDPPTENVGTLIFGSAVVELCGGTSPRVFDGAIVWCEIIAGVPRGRFVRLAPNGTANLGDVRTLNPGAPLAAPSVGSLAGGSGEEFQPPVISGTHVAWVEDTVAGPILFFAERNPVTGDLEARQPTTIGVDSLADISGSAVVYLGVRDALFNDLFAVDLRDPGAGIVAITDDIPPQGDPSIDGDRVSWSDVAAGEQILMADRTNVRWLSATNELEFEPQTSSQATAWLSSRGNAVCLAARLLPQRSNPTVFFEQGPDGACEPIVFGGPVKAEAPWAVGGTRVLYLTPTLTPDRFNLRVRDLRDPTTAITVATLVQPTMAIDPDGDSFVYVANNGGIVAEALPPVLTDYVASNTVIEAPPALEIPHIDVDNGIVVYQLAGARDDPRDPGEVRCRVPGGTFHPVLDNGVAIVGRGPKVAVGTGLRPNLLAYTALNNGRPLARACVLTCNVAAASCTRPSRPIGIGAGEDLNVRLARDGRIAYLTDETGLQQVALVDFFAGSRALISDGAEVERGGLDLAEGRAVWADPSLGTNDIWEYITK